MYEICKKSIRVMRENAVFALDTQSNETTSRSLLLAVRRTLSDKQTYTNERVAFHAPVHLGAAFSSLPLTAESGLGIQIVEDIKCSHMFGLDLI